MLSQKLKIHSSGIFKALVNCQNKFKKFLCDFGSKLDFWRSIANCKYSRYEILWHYVTSLVAVYSQDIKINAIENA